MEFTSRSKHKAHRGSSSSSFCSFSFHSRTPVWLSSSVVAQGQPDACTVLVRCAEKGRVNLHAGTYVNGNDGVPSVFIYVPV